MIWWWSPFSEQEQGLTDLNNDGDTYDRVLHAYDATTNRVFNLGHAVGTPKAVFKKNKIVFPVSEILQGDQDLNGDADSRDNVIHVWHKNRHLVTNTQRAGLLSDQHDKAHVYVVAGEHDQGQQDFNGDGDASDHVLQALDLKTMTFLNLQFAIPAYSRFSSARRSGLWGAFRSRPRKSRPKF